MRLVILIVLGLFCCCHAFEQTTSRTQQQGRLTRQHVADFVEQHIQYVKQQPPFTKQQIKEGEVKVQVARPKANDQKAAANIKKFMESHITKVLQHFTQQRKQQKIQLESNSSLNMPPPPLAHKIDSLKKEAQNTHIPQDLNQQTDFKNELESKQQYENKEINVKTAAMTDSTQKTPTIANKVEDQGQQDNLQSFQRTGKYNVENKHTGLPPIKVNHTYPNVTIVDSAEVQKRETQDESVVVSEQVQPTTHQSISQHDKDKALGSVKEQSGKNRRTEAEFVSDNVKETAHQISHPITEVAKQNSRKQTTVLVEIHGSAEQQHVAKLEEEIHLEKPVISTYAGEIMQHSKRQATIGKKIFQEGFAISEEKQRAAEQTRNQIPQLLTEQIESIFAKIHQHIPQVIDQHGGAQIDKNATEDISKSLKYIQSIVEKIQKLVPQIMNEEKSKVNDIEIPSVIPEKIQHVPPVTNQLNTETNQDKPFIPEHIKTIVDQIHQHVPLIVKEFKKQVKEYGQKSQPPEHIQKIGQPIHQHVSQVEDPSEKLHSVVPSNIEGVVQQINLLIPQVINDGEDHIAQEQNYYVVPNTNADQIINPEYAIAKIPSVISSTQPVVVHPVVHTVDKLTQHEVVKNTNIVPSHVQQAQKEHHISPVRAT